MSKLSPIHPEAKRFIDEVINGSDGQTTLTGKNFKEIVEYANASGYEVSDTELLNGLNKYFENKISLPQWMANHVGGLAIWAAWEGRVA